MKKVNIILCTYNGERFLPALLDSVFAQTYGNIDIFARDDGSKDDTKEILKRYAEKNTDTVRLHIVEDELGNLGYSRNFMRTMRASGDADYYCFCDQDDVWLPDKVARAVSAMEKESQDQCLLYSSNYDVCDRDLNVIGASHPLTPFEELDVGKSLSLYDGGWMLGFTLVMNRKLKETAFDNNAEQIYSHDIWVQAVAVGFQGKLLTDDKVTVHFRRHENTTSIAESKVNRSFLEAWKYRLNEFLGNGKMFQSVRNGINTYASVYENTLPRSKDRLFLKRFADHGDGKKHIFGKLFYPHRMKKSLVVELAWRFAILMGKV